MSPAYERDSALEAWLAETRAWADRELEARVGADASVPARLAEAMRYALFGGGKRLRPALVRMIATHFGGTDDGAAAAAVAVECVHTYSLVHDDLPCMDDDDLRRGRPTCHKVFGEALAVLAGDALLTFAFESLASERHGTRGAELAELGAQPDERDARAAQRAARSGPHDARPAHVLPRDPRASDPDLRTSEMVRVLARGAGPSGMVGGQALDLEPPGPATRALVEEIHRRKTAALIAASAELGALSAGASASEREAARAFGSALGRCFQATDDILDVTGDAATLGKTPGKDARKHKRTLVSALGLDGARAEAQRLAGEARAAAERLGCGPHDLPIALTEHLLARKA